MAEQTGASSQQIPAAHRRLIRAPDCPLRQLTPTASLPSILSGRVTHLTRHPPQHICCASESVYSRWAPPALSAGRVTGIWINQLIVARPTILTTLAKFKNLVLKVVGE